MNDETSELISNLAYDIDWKTEISSLRSGIFRTFDRDAADVLQNKVGDYIAQKRDLLRHKWAIDFFTKLSDYVNSLLESIIVFKSNVKSVGKKCIKEIGSIQNLARVGSDSQIFLHSQDVETFLLPDVSETSALFRSKHPIFTLLGKSENELSGIFHEFANTHPAVVSAKDVTLEQKMKHMSEHDETHLKAIFKKVKEMSSPLWSTNTMGYLEHSQELTTVFTIGVFDQSNGLLQNKYTDEFSLGSNKPTFASTHETDRITFFQSQCFSPVFAVNNSIGYMRDAETKLKQESFPVYYLDEKWNQRMVVEGFDILPKMETDRILPNWVNAIVYDFVKFDEAKRTYYIESLQGDILNGGFLELGQRRDLAFDQFQIRGLDQEVEERLQQMILDKGRPAITSIIQSAKVNIRNYLTQTANLSAIELDRVNADDHAYQMVRELLEKEVSYLRELVF